MEEKGRATLCCSTLTPVSVQYVCMCHVGHAVLPVLFLKRCARSRWTGNRECTGRWTGNRECTLVLLSLLRMSLLCVLACLTTTPVTFRYAIVRHDGYAILLLFTLIHSEDASSL
jgi:hypothetical protein